jgi:hypothetical protein
MIALFKKYQPLCRFPIALYAAYSALTGSLLAGGCVLLDGVLLALSVFLLSMGIRPEPTRTGRDALMDRTRQRPLPSRDNRSVTGPGCAHPDLIRPHGLNPRDHPLVLECRA